MKFSICNELYSDRSFDAACASAAEIGYQGIEIAPFTLGRSVFEIDSLTRRETVRSASAHGLQIVGLHWLLAKTEGLHLTSANQEVRRRTREYLVGLVDLCADLGGSIMVLGSPLQRQLDGTTSLEQGFVRTRDLLQELAPHLELNNVTLAIEPLGPEETNFLNTAKTAMELIEAVGSPQVGLILDVKAMSTEREPIPEIIERSRNHLKHFHANDPNRQGPGMGEVNFEPILNSLRQVGYDNWVSVEVFDYRPGIETLARESFRTLQRCSRS